MSVPVARRDPHLRRFPLRRRVIHAAGGAFRLVVPASSDALLLGSESLARSAARGDLPHWADLWPASIALARVLARGPSLVDRTVADLGCGLGLAGLAAARRGARVWFLDRSEDALRFAAFNAAQAGVTAAVTRVFDWSNDELPDTIDTLLLADVLYAWRHGPTLLRHVASVVDRGGRVLCADPGRPTADDVFSELRTRWPHSAVETVTVVDRDGDSRSEVRIAEVVGAA